MVGLTDDITQKESGVITAIFESKEPLLKAIERVQAANAEILDVVAQEGSLEDYFVETIGRAA
jgi:hypothetical protein